MDVPAAKIVRPMISSEMPMVSPTYKMMRETFSSRLLLNTGDVEYSWGFIFKCNSLLHFRFCQTPQSFQVTLVNKQTDKSVVGFHVRIADLMGPPHHKVREDSDPQNGAQEGDRKEFS